MGYYTPMKNDDYKNKEETTVCNTIQVAEKKPYIVIYTCYQLHKISWLQITRGD